MQTLTHFLRFVAVSGWKGSNTEDKRKGRQEIRYLQMGTAQKPKPKPGYNAHTRSDQHQKKTGIANQITPTPKCWSSNGKPRSRRSGWGAMHYPVSATGVRIAG
jgi:hypothetical protein